MPLRIGYMMKETDAGGFLTGEIGRFRGMDDPLRAAFANIDRPGDPIFFRPFAHPDEKEEEKK
jgi:hypothetical protein